MVRMKSKDDVSSYIVYELEGLSWVLGRAESMREQSSRCEVRTPYMSLWEPDSALFVPPRPYYVIGRLGCGRHVRLASCCFCVFIWEVLEGGDTIYIVVSDQSVKGSSLHT